jgi:S-adenosylmethionine:tRNA ribosyltransferase-isomerase
VPDSTAAMLNQARSAGGRIFAVGTTTARVLESVTDEKGKIRAGEGWTDIFLYPGYAFKAVDSLVTNFHLPRSTLLMLVCALGGRELILRAYQEAVAKQYRFFSYGDAMLIV